MMRHKLKILSVLALVLLTAACAPLGSMRDPDSAPLVWESVQRQLEQIDTWSARGKVALRNEQRSGSLRMHWQQSAQLFMLRLFSLFNVVNLTMTGGAGLVELHDMASGQSMLGTDATEVLYQYSGWLLPIDQFRFWMLGHPGDASDYTVGPDGVLESIRQDDFVVHYLQYDWRLDPPLPSKIEVLHQDTKLTLSITIQQGVQSVPSSVKRVSIPNV